MALVEFILNNNIICMQGLGKYTNEELKLRVSNASTEDIYFSSDDDCEIKQVFASSLVNEATRLFSPISSDQKEIYKELGRNLQILYAKLEEELHPIDVREELAIHAGSICLSSTLMSNLNRRRSAIIK